MAAPAKTAGTIILSLQQLASNSVVVSGVQDVSTKLAATFWVHLGRDDIGGVLAAGVRMRIEGSAKASGNDQWFPLAEYTSGVALPEAEALTGTINSGATNLTVASTTNLNLFDIILIKNTTIANSEFARIRKVTLNTSIDIIDGLTNAQTGSTLYNQAEVWAPQLDLVSVTRVRLVVDGSNTGRTVVIESFMTTGDSIG